MIVFEHYATAYKVFMLLAFGGALPEGTRLTPSKRVDAVWHVHLHWTKSYFDLAALVADGDIARCVHEPARGVALEDDRFRDQYMEALAAFQVLKEHVDLPGNFPEVLEKALWPLPNSPMRLPYSGPGPGPGKLTGPTWSDMSPDISEASGDSYDGYNDCG